MGIVIDLTGQKFGRLTVIKRVENYIQPNGKNIIQWLCKCDCGNEIFVTSGRLTSGNTKSCGCIRKETASKQAKITKLLNKKYNTYNLTGDFGIGYTFKNEKFYFDLEDYDKIKNYCWRIDKDGYMISTIHRNGNIKMHRLIMNCPDDMEVDHIYHDNFDNRKEFLRIVTRSQNQMNRDKTFRNNSGIKGIHWEKSSNKWRVIITVNNNNIHLGSYKNIEDAIKIRKEAEEKYFGEYNYKERSRGRSMKNDKIK